MRIVVAHALLKNVALLQLIAEGLHFSAFHYMQWLLSPQHPDDVVKQEVVSEVIKQFHIQMDHVPIISLYDSEKGMGLNISNKDIEQYMHTVRRKKHVEKQSHTEMTSHVEMKNVDIYQI